jgi:hypothetical protein
MEESKDDGALVAPAVDVEKKEDTIHKSLLNPELRLSRRQREVLGIVGIKGDVSEKQKERNKVAGERLKRYHTAKKTAKLEAEAERLRLFELENKVRVGGQKKRDANARVRLKREVVEEQSESEEDKEVVRRARKVAKTAKVLEKLDEKISRVAKAAQPANPYLEAMMRRHF